MECNPIGYFQSEAKYPYDVPRQPDMALTENQGVIVLNSQCNFEQALEDLEGFSHIWIIFQFHKNNHWNPKTLPPRGTQKRGLFATRSPYRPNPIGISAVKLSCIKGLKIYVTGHDLLDGTPILDIKPYIYADHIMPIRQGWLEQEISESIWQCEFQVQAQEEIRFLKEHGGPDCLEAFLKEQLSCAPFRKTRKRIKQTSETQWKIAYRTWRILLNVDLLKNMCCVESIRSGYSPQELENLKEDPFFDKKVHLLFNQWKKLI